MEYQELVRFSRLGIGRAEILTKQIPVYPGTKDATRIGVPERQHGSIHKFHALELGVG
jgi:hypothetical protein